MSSDIRLGRIAGVEVGLSWSVVFVAWLVAWSLASSLLPQQVPDLSPTAYWAAGTVAAVLFFASLLAHELAHAIVARREGVEVEGITLWLFGGVAQLHGEAATPRAEARIAGVGPATSAAVAVLAWVLAQPFGNAETPSLIAATLGWLATINLILAIFNLLPAAPLDGGRLLRAWVWRRTDDRLRATVVSARAGRVLGLLLVGLGLAEFAFQANLGGLWTLFIGGFLILAASAESRSAKLRDSFADMTVADVMTPDPVALRDWLLVEDMLADHVRGHRFTTFPLTGFDGRPSGVTTLAMLTRVPPAERRSTRAREAAVPIGRITTARPDEPVIDLVERLPGAATGRALVFDGDDLVGIVSPRDISRAMQLRAAGAGSRGAAGVGRVDDEPDAGHGLDSGGAPGVGDRSEPGADRVRDQITNASSSP